MILKDSGFAYKGTSPFKWLISIQFNMQFECFHRSREIYRTQSMLPSIGDA